MRNAKFEAWDPKEKKMWNSNHIVVGDGVFLYGGHNTSTLEHTYVLKPDFIARESTGLKDSNGKEIYEGDILENPKDYKGLASVVRWDNDGAYFHVFRGETSSGYTLRGEVSRAVIIGNIYQNPELLK